MQHQYEAAGTPPNGTDWSTVKVMHRVLCHTGFNDANDIADQKDDQQRARQKIKQNIQSVGADRSTVMQHWGANHGAISYGHIGADIITLCSMLRIPISMHNVDEADIFRPAAWNAFGMDKEGQDYRACAAYGPMYRNIR